MIDKLYCSLSSFKALDFHRGLNILLAERAPGATDRQTRNRAGKSSFVAIVHLLTGGNISAKSIFRNDLLIDHWFGMELDVAGHRVIVERSGQPNSRIRLFGNRIEDVVTNSKVKDDCVTTSLKAWKETLGSLMFRLPVHESTEATGTYKPTFRQVFSYFAREVPDGLKTYERHVSAGGKEQYQVPLSYLLGIDWRVPQELARLRNDERGIAKSIKVLKAEQLLAEVGSPATIRTRLVVAEERCKRLEHSLKNFRVLPEYEEFEREAKEISSELRKLSNRIVIDETLIDDLQKSLSEEKTA